MRPVTERFPAWANNHPRGFSAMWFAVAGAVPYAMWQRAFDDPESFLLVEQESPGTINFGGTLLLVAALAQIGVLFIAPVGGLVGYLLSIVVGRVRQ